MAYAGLLKQLAEQERIEVVRLDAEMREALDAGLIRIRPVWDIDVVTLTNEGRRMVGLPLLPEPRWWEFWLKL